MSKQISKEIFEHTIIVNNPLAKEAVCDTFFKQIKNFLTRFALPEEFKSSNNLLNAFTHKSFNHESSNLLPHNERLEFLGDAALELIVTRYLFDEFSDLSEGQLSKLRSSIVNEDSLTAIARSIKLGDYLLLGRGELREKGFEKESILSDAFEALMGAIYLDCGYEVVREFFLKSCEITAQKTGHNLLSIKTLENFDAKSRLQEIIMKKYKVHPEYTFIEVGSGVNKEFEVSFNVLGQKVDSYTHRSKKKAMQLVAREILNNNKIEKINI